MPVHMNRDDYDKEFPTWRGNSNCNRDKTMLGPRGTCFENSGKDGTQPGELRGRVSASHACTASVPSWHLAASPCLLSLLVREPHRLSVALRNNVLGFCGRASVNFLASTNQCLLLLPLVSTVLREVPCMYKLIYFLQQRLLSLLYS